jgi:diguanylate cyclase (GGDEF)-like protein/PAS domain S-box-containing protein
VEDGRDGEDVGAGPLAQHRADSAPMSTAEQAELFRDIALGSPNGVVAADDDGMIVWAKPVAEALFGSPPGGLTGRPLTDLVPQNVRGWVRQLRARILRGERLRQFLTTGMRRDGTTFDASVSAGVRRDRGGRVTGINLVLADVTEEQRVQRDLTEALARSRARFDQSRIPQAMLDLRGRFVEINDAACALLGWSRDDLVGRDSSELIHPRHPEQVRHELTLMRDGQRVSGSYETVGVRADGHQVPLLIDITAVRDANGKAYELAAIARDLSELREVQDRLVSQEAFFRALNREASDVSVVTDKDSRIIHVTPSLTQVLGYRPEDLDHLDGADLAHPDDLPAIAEARARIRARPGARERFTLRIKDAWGQWRWFETTATNCLDDPDIGGVVANLREVTSEIESQRALRDSEARYRAIAKTAQEGIIAVSPEGEILFANERLVEILGMPMEEIYRSGGSGVFAASEAAAWTLRLAARGDLGPYRYDQPYRHPDGTRRTLYVAASSLVADDGTPLGSLAMVSDVTTQRLAEDRLRRQALHDALTGLPNRVLFVDRLATAATRQARSSGRGVAVLFLDLDHFKLVNDTHGHEAGDRLLVEVAGRVEAAVRDTDTVARLGGDEFAVICEDADAAVAEAVAERVLAALRPPMEVLGAQVHVGVSIGIALAPPHPVADLLRHADSAMYTAKLTRRGGVVTYDRELSQDSERRLALSNALRVALGAGTLPLAYQPIVDIATGQLLGLEALLRWHHPELGLLGPEEVVLAAETAGLSFELDRVVLRTAAAEVVGLKDSGAVEDSVYVAVNVSARTAQQQRLRDLVDEVLAESGLGPSCLTLEITEGVIVDNADHAVALVTRLHDRGVRVLIDDFGTGYNSLSHLQRLPVHGLKVDRSFVRDIVQQPEALAIVRAIVELAGAIGVMTVAEGVESEAQARLLLGLGCTVGQGFLWGAAVSADSLRAPTR